MPRILGEDNMELNLVPRVSRNLAKTVHRILHSFLADYTCTLYAWQTNEMCGRFMNPELPTGSWVKNLDRQATFQSVERVGQRAQTGILSLRKICLADGLQTDLAAINKEMGMPDLVYENWDEEASRRHNSSKKFLLALLAAPVTQINDQLTRVNEWLLQVMESYSSLMELHRNICLEYMSLRGPPVLSSSQTDWKRGALKYWFLDTAAMETKSPASSHSNGDSDATFRPLDEGDSDFDNGEGMVGRTVPVLKYLDDEYEESSGYQQESFAAQLIKQPYQLGDLGKWILDTEIDMLSSYVKSPPDDYDPEDRHSSCPEGD